jgi:hypothetical protein
VTNHSYRSFCGSNHTHIMKWTLARLPASILENIFIHVSAYELMSTVYLCGDSALWMKLKSDGVHKLELDLNMSSKHQFERCLVFSKLQSLSLLWDSFQVAIDHATFALSLPCSLRNLEIHHLDALKMWIRKMSDSEKDDPTTFVYHWCGWIPIKIEDTLPNLQRLSLRSLNSFAWQSADVRWTSPMRHYFFQHLPRHLQHLHLEPLIDSEEHVWKLLPPSLTHFSYESWLGLPKLGLPPSTFPLWDSLTHLDFRLRVIPQSPIIFPPNLTSVRWDAPIELLPLLPPSLRSLVETPSTYDSLKMSLLNNDLIAALPRALKTLIVITTCGVSESANFPPLLTTLDIHPMFPWTTFAHLPRTITEFRIGTAVSPKIPWETLPPKLRTLFPMVDYNCPITPSILSSFPSTLTHFALPTAYSGMELMSSLPRTLVTLNVLQISWQQGSDLFDLLPPSVTSLQVDCPIRDDWLLTLPTSVQLFKAFNITFTGRLLQEGHKTWTYQPLVAWDRTKTSALPVLSSAPHHTNPHFKMPQIPSIEYLPTSITELDLSKWNRHHTFANPSVALNLPNLRILKLAYASQWNQRSMPFGNLLQLEELFIGQVDHHEWRQVEALPPNLIKFHLQYMLSHDPLPLPPTLTYLASSSYKIEAIAQLPNIQTWHVGGGPEMGIPGALLRCPSLTDIAFLSRCNLSHLLSFAPNLKKIDIRACEVLHTDLLACSNLSGVEKLICNRLIIFNPLDVLASDPDHHMGTNDDGTDWNLQLAAERAIQRQYPNLKLETQTGISLGPFPGLYVNFPHFCDSISSKITSLTMNRVPLPPKFGRHLPQTLVCLNVLFVTNLDHNTPQELPRSLRELHISAAHWDMYAFKQLPNQIHTLELRKTKKFWPKHARSLPDSLTHLTLETWKTNNQMISNLPRGITHLQFIQVNNLPVAGLCGFPPHLKYLGGGLLKCNDPSFAMLLPATLTDLNITSLELTNDFVQAFLYNKKTHKDGSLLA